MTYIDELIAEVRTLVTPKELMRTVSELLQLYVGQLVKLTTTDTEAYLKKQGEIRAMRNSL